MEDLLERIITIADAFGRAEIPYSFGGAIALGYYATARATRDIDINVYLEVDDAERALDCLQDLGVPTASKNQRAEIRRNGQIGCTGTRFPWISSSRIWTSMRAAANAGASTRCSITPSTS